MQEVASHTLDPSGNWASAKLFQISFAVMAHGLKSVPRRGETVLLRLHSSSNSVYSVVRNMSTQCATCTCESVSCWGAFDSRKKFSLLWTSAWTKWTLFYWIWVSKSKHWFLLAVVTAGLLCVNWARITLPGNIGTVCHTGVAGWCFVINVMHQPDHPKNGIS